MFSKLVVSSASDSYALTTVPQVKRELGVADTETSFDAQIGVMIEQASSMIASYCNRVFAQETVTETFRIDESVNAILLSRTPITSITSVTINGSLADASSYDFKSSGVLVRVGEAISAPLGWEIFHEFLGTVVVVYQAGWVLPYQTGSRTLPYDIEKACIQQVKVINDRLESGGGVKRESVPFVYSVEYETSSDAKSDTKGLAPEVSRILSPYVRKEF